MEWTTYKSAFSPDNQPRYICVPGVSLADWNTYYRLLLRTTMGVKLLRDGEPVALPEHIGANLFEPGHRHLLALDMAGLKIFWRLEIIDMMRFQFLPQAIVSERHATLLFRIMSTLGRRLDREVFLMHPEGTRVLFRYVPGREGIVYMRSMIAKNNAELVVKVGGAEETVKKLRHVQPSEMISLKLGKEKFKRHAEGGENALELSIR